jgi:hypothetical protein
MRAAAHGAPNPAAAIKEIDGGGLRPHPIAHGHGVDPRAHGSERLREPIASLRLRLQHRQDEHRVAQPLVLRIPATSMNSHKWQSMVLRGHQWQSMVLKGHQWQSMVLNGNPWEPVVSMIIYDHQRQSMGASKYIFSTAINGNQRQSTGPHGDC